MIATCNSYVKKLSQLRSAVMYVSSSNLIKLGNDVITAVRIDDEGQLWLVTNNPPHIPLKNVNRASRTFMFL